MLRLFAALPIPDEVADLIVPQQTGLDGAKWSPRENLHITLRFLGDVSPTQAEDVDLALGEIMSPPLEIALQGAGHFGGDEPHAIWLGVSGNAALNVLQSRCERACRRAGLPADKRSWTPHVTIAYLNRSIDPLRVAAFQAGLNLFKAGPWLADRFYLYSSHSKRQGSNLYRIEAEYPLIHPPVG
jgi:RNA 2',3'-cyclic 3'-phosphodiesterase